MADTKLTALGSVTPVLTDITYVVDDPGGTPISGKMTLQALMDLFEANMSVDLTSFTITGTTAQFNTALSDGSFATLAGTETLTNKTLTTPTIAGATISADLDPNADGTINLGNTTNRYAIVHTDSIDLNGTTISGTTGDSGVLEDLVTLGAATADNQALVSTGAGVLAWESGATLRTSLGLAIGTDVQAYSAVLATPVGQQHLYIPAAAMISRTTSGAAAGSTELATNDVMIESFDFDTAADEHVQFSLQMPKNWNEGTLVAQFIWSHPSTTTNFGVTWAIQAVALADGDAGDTAFGTAVLVDDTGGTTDDVYISPESGAITVAGTPGAEEWVVFQVYRDVSDANDTLAVDARLHGVKIHWTNDALTAD